MRFFSFAATGFLTAALLLSGTGCTRETKTVEGEAGKKLTVKAPSDTSVTAGDTAEINVSITREKFNDPVTLNFTGLPDGVTVMESDRNITKDSSSARFTLKADVDARPVEDHRATVTASGGGLTQEATFLVTVKK